MKFLSNPDKLIFCIGIGVVGFLFMVSYLILNKLPILILLLFFWIFIAFFLVRNNYVAYEITDDKFLVRYMKYYYEIKFNDIEYIVQYSNYNNLMQESRYELIVNSKININPKVLKIENRVFSKWLSNNSKNFIIKKQYIL